MGNGKGVVWDELVGALDSDNTQNWLRIVHVSPNTRKSHGFLKNRGLIGIGSFM